MSQLMCWPGVRWEDTRPSSAPFVGSDAGDGRADRTTYLSRIHNIIALFPLRSFPPNFHCTVGNFKDTATYTCVLDTCESRDTAKSTKRASTPNFWTTVEFFIEVCRFDFNQCPTSFGHHGDPNERCTVKANNYIRAMKQSHLSSH